MSFDSFAWEIDSNLIYYLLQTLKYTLAVSSTNLASK